MRKRLASISAAMILALPAALHPAADARPGTAWTNGKWFDGTAFRSVEVYSVGDRLTLKRPPAVERTVDLAGRYVTGAFGEAHNHNIPGGDTDATIRTYLEQGIFYVMIQGNVPEAPGELAERINGPGTVDVAFANGLFTAPGGHPTALVERNIKNGGMTDADRHGGFLHPVATKADIDREWDTKIRPQHPDFIKIVLAYSEDRVAGIPRPASDRHALDPALAAHIVKRAHRDGLRVSAHVESAYDFDVAIDAGVDVIAHMPGFWPDDARVAAKGTAFYKISEASARRAGQKRVPVVTTVGESLRNIADGGKRVAMREALLDVYRHNFSVLARHGVRIVIGSDQFRSTSVPEALDIQKAGLLTPAAALRALTVDAAATIFPRRAPFGLAEGAPADFIVLDANPLEDFAAIQRLRIRVKAGRELPLVQAVH
jgi:amidohydrolase family protein